MERIFGRGETDPNKERNPFKFGYRVDVFFHEDMGKLLNSVVPVKFRSERARVVLGGLSLAKATELCMEVQEEYGSEITSYEGQAGWLVAKVVPEIPHDDIRRF